MRQNIEITTSCNLCVSCGICKGICPMSCISFQYLNGMYIPKVDKPECVDCGICLKVCPGSKRTYQESKASVDVMYGTYTSIYNAWSRNSVLRHVSASGGVVSTIVEVLLENGFYDTAFILDTYSCNEQLKTVPVRKGDIPENWAGSSYPKSRYLPVSHERAVEYVREHSKTRIIFVGTSCAITGLKRTVQLLHRNLSQYLFIGLFCDSVFNYQVMNYFSKNLCEKRNIQSIHFKNKESGGWPGNMKLFYEDGSFEYKDKNERGDAKKFFMPEACLYCIDKLNVNADISVGDNYTDQNSTELGSNTVIIRTSVGEDAWNMTKEALEFEKVDINKLRKAQYLDDRLNNLYFGALKEKSIRKKSGIKVQLNEGVDLIDRPVLYEQAWRNALIRVNAGASYDRNQELIILHKKKLRILLEKIYYRVKRYM